MSNTTYTTPAPMRWDQVAYIVYGDATKFQELVEANPNVPIATMLPANTVLNVPVLEEPEITAALLPPWKR